MGLHPAATSSPRSPSSPGQPHQPPFQASTTLCKLLGQRPVEVCVPQWGQARELARKKDGRDWRPEREDRKGSRQRRDDRRREARRSGRDAPNPRRQSGWRGPAAAQQPPCPPHPPPLDKSCSSGREITCRNSKGGAKACSGQRAGRASRGPPRKEAAAKTRACHCALSTLLSNCRIVSPD